jgi:predicted nucleotidyltransferase component of viral defense system
MLREETVEPGTLGLLKKIVALPEITGYRLVGGTALSLLYGHRKSIDLDLFTDQPLDKEALVPALEENFGSVISTNANRQHIYQCIIGDIRVDFVSVRDPFLNPIQVIDKIPFADIKDLIALKLNAVKGRGVKKDFWDVAKLLEYYSMNELFQFYYQRYSYDDSIALIRSMVYFNDAEDKIEPEALDGMTWEKVKQTIERAMKKYYKKRN